MLHFRAVTNQFTLVFNPVCQCGTHEGFTQDMGSVLFWRINYYLPNDNGHAKNEGKGNILYIRLFFDVSDELSPFTTVGNRRRVQVGLVYWVECHLNSSLYQRVWL